MSNCHSCANILKEIIWVWVKFVRICNIRNKKFRINFSHKTFLNSITTTVKIMKLCHSHWPISHISWIIKNQDSKSCAVKKDEWFKNGIISVTHIKAHKNYQQTEIWYFIPTRLSMPSSWEKKETKLLIGKLYSNNAKKKGIKEGKRRERRKREIIRCGMVHKCGFDVCVFFLESQNTIQPLIHF